MMFKRPVYDRRIFFPWETQGGLRRFFVAGRVGPIAAVLAAGLFVVWTIERERQRAGERQTVLALAEVKPAVLRYVVEHDGRCPDNLDVVLSLLKRDSLPRDGWGRKLRLVCAPGVSDEDYILMSDGPDGYPGGLDRIEY